MSSSRSVLAHDAALHARPTDGGDDAVEDADVEVVLDVDAHRVDDGVTRGRASALHAHPLSQQDGLDRLEDDEQVERERQVLDVEEVVLQLLQRVLDAGAVGVAHLRPAGEPGPDDVALAVERNLLVSARRTRAARAAARRGSCRPRSTFQSCGSSSSRVCGAGSGRSASRAGRLPSTPTRRRSSPRRPAHRAELVTVKTRPCWPTRAGDRAPARRGQLDGERADQQPGGAATSPRPRPRCPAARLTRQQPALAEALARRSASSDAGSRRRSCRCTPRRPTQVVERHAVELHLEQLVHRQLAARVGQADDDAIDAARARSTECRRSCR